MRKLLLTVLLLLFSMNFSFAQDKNFGAGIILGNPTGISLKGWMGRTTAWDAAIAWNFSGSDALSIHADYLWHNYRLIKISKGKMPLYYGFGAKGVLASDFILGVRGVVGLDYMFSGTPLDLFLELAPSFNVIPSTDFDVDFGLGMRYFF